MVTCYQYDDNNLLQTKNEIIEGTYCYSRDAPSQFVCSGFGDQSLGIMIPESKSNEMSSFDSILKDKKNHTALKYLFGDLGDNLQSMQEKYLTDHQLYFGYFSSGGRGTISPSDFSYLAIKDALENKKDTPNIDIFCKFNNRHLDSNYNNDYTSYALKLCMGLQATSV